jgi:hypothetical protein
MTQTSKRPKATGRRRAPHTPVPRPEQVVRTVATNSPIRAAFWERASAALKRIVEEAEEEALIRAVSAPTDAGALARAISETLPTDSASSELDPMASLIARGAEQKLELLKQAGGGLSASDVSRLLHISRQAVDKRRREGKLLAVPRGSDYTYPACQFEDDRTISGLPQMLAARTVGHPWATLAFLVTLEDELGCSPVQALQHQDPKLKDRAIRLARVAAGGDGFG